MRASDAAPAPPRPLRLAPAPLAQRAEHGARVHDVQLPQQVAAGAARCLPPHLGSLPRPAVVEGRRVWHPPGVVRTRSVQTGRHLHGPPALKVRVLFGSHLPLLRLTLRRCMRAVRGLEGRERPTALTPAAVSARCLGQGMYIYFKFIFYNYFF